MVREMKALRTPPWKALLAIAVVGGGLLWHVLACTESPMAFSPDGKALALVTMDPYGGQDELVVRGERLYRLMTVADERVRVLEETHDYMLTGPSWSPDGKRLVYLRVPLLSKEAAERLKAAERVPEGGKPVEWPSVEELLELPPVRGEPAPQPLKKSTWVEVSGLPTPTDETRADLADTATPAVLVVREAASGKVVSAVRIELHLEEYDASNLLIAYVTMRPQFGAKGEWVYLSDGTLLKAVNVRRRQQRILAPGNVSAVSPDGRFVAAMVGDRIVLVRTDGSAGRAVLWERPVSLSGLAWADAETLAVFSPPKEKGEERTPGVIGFLNPDATVGRSIELSLPAGGSDNSGQGALAVSPNGKHVVLAFDSAVYFLDAEGKRIADRAPPEGEVLAQPVFAPDSSRVALKHLTKSGEGRGHVDAVVYVSPEGKEIGRVAIPLPERPEAEGAGGK